MISGTISHYRILEKLGEGGMGEVYLAEDTRLGRRVALKFLPASYQYDPDRRGRFLKEARAASALRSPYIAAIYDIGEHEDSRFIAMEYVEGELLSRRIERGPLAAAIGIDVAMQVADALDEAHSLGIIHRDIKSSNIIVTERGLVKVLDFGLAKLSDQHGKSGGEGDQTLLFGKETSPGVVLGTAAYMSPEQARGLNVDGRTDIFSLGVLLYEMVTGKRPFEGATASDLIVAILSRDPTPVVRHSAEIPPQLEWIISKALRKNRDERYQSAREFFVDMKNLKQAIELEDSLERTVRLDSASGAMAASNTRSSLQKATGLDAASSELSDPHRRPRRRPSHKAIDSLAVLPLANAGADPDMEYLSDGITEGIINSLSRLPKLRVMARSTVFRYKGREADAQAIGGELGVRAVVTGRVQRVGERLVIGTELVDVSDGAQLWGEQYNRKFSDIFALQEEISNEISENLRLKLGGKEKKRLSKKPAINTEAYELYLKGRYHWNKWTEEGFRKSVEYFEQAIEKDAGFALPYAGLSDAYGTLWLFNYLPPQQSVPKSKAAALKALELDDTLAEAHMALGDIKLFYEWDWPGAEREFKRALELNPNYAVARHMYAFYLQSLGHFDEAFAEMKRASELDPLSLLINSGMGFVLFHARRYDEAIKQYKKLLEMDPSFPLIHEGLGHAYERLGMYAEAVEEFIQVVPHWSGSLETIPALREAYATSGIKGFWQKWLEYSVNPSKRKYVSAYWVAAIYACLDERDRAFEWLEKAYEERLGFLVQIKIEPRFESLHSDPRFQDLLRRIGIP